MPWTPLGELTLPQTSYSGVDGRGEGQEAVPPKPWIKKLKLSCRVTHIDALLQSLSLITIKQLQLMNRGVDRLVTGETYVPPIFMKGGRIHGNVPQYFRRDVV